MTTIPIVAGIDEVGRGAHAGPVVAGCVVFKPNQIALSSRAPLLRSSQKGADRSLASKQLKIKINDSKKLTAGQREVSAKWIKENALAWGIGVGSVTLINSRGIVAATNFAFRSAIRSVQRQLSGHIDYLLIDAFYVPRIEGIRRAKQFPIIKGDQKSASIAAASIVAKVYRDELMIMLSNRANYRKYFWNKNKGYGTKIHREAIKTHGITCYHRKQFVRKIV